MPRPPGATGLRTNGTPNLGHGSDSEACTQSTHQPRTARAYAGLCLPGRPGRPREIGRRGQGRRRSCPPLGQVPAMSPAARGAPLAARGGAASRGPASWSSVAVRRASRTAVGIAFQGEARYPGPQGRCPVEPVERELGLGGAPEQGHGRHAVGASLDEGPGRPRRASGGRSRRPSGCGLATAILGDDPAALQAGDEHPGITLDDLAGPALEVLDPRKGAGVAPDPVLGLLLLSKDQLGSEESRANARATVNRSSSASIVRGAAAGPRVRSRPAAGRTSPPARA